MPRRKRRAPVSDERRLHRSRHGPPAPELGKLTDSKRLALHAGQRALLAELVDLLSRRAPDELDPLFSPQWLAAADDAARLRVVVDQVATLTDRQAIAWRLRLSHG